MSGNIQFYEGSAERFEAAKSGGTLLPKSLYLIDGKPHLALSTSTAFAFVDTNMVSQMIAGLSTGGGEIQLGTTPGKAPTANGSAGSSTLAAHEDHTHAAQKDISGNAATATTAGKLAATRTFRLSGAVSGSGQFNGENDCTIQTSLTSDLQGVPHWFGTREQLPPESERDPDTVYMVYDS